MILLTILWYKNKESPDANVESPDTDVFIDPSILTIPYEQFLEVQDDTRRLFKGKEEDFDTKTLRDINNVPVIPVCQRTKKVVCSITKILMDKRWKCLCPKVGANLLGRLLVELK